MRRLPLWILLVGLAASASRTSIADGKGAAAGGSKTPSGETRPLFANDARLARPISVGRGRVYLGELLEELSDIGRVPLSVSLTRGPVDGIQLTAYLRERPLREVMQGLQDLFTSRYDVWEWQEAPRGGKGYVLVHQRSPAEAAAAARRAVMDAWGQDLRSYYEVAKLSDEQREARAHGRQGLFPGGHALQDRLDMVAALAPADLDALLHGTFVPLDVSRLSARARQGLRFGLPQDPAEPARKQAGFQVRWDDRHMAPVLWGQNEQGALTNVVGGFVWDYDWLGKDAPGWRNLADPEAQKFLVRSTEPGAPVGKSVPEPSLPHWLKRAFQEQGVCSLADQVAAGGRRVRSAWLGNTAEQTLIALLARTDFPQKKVGETNLLRDLTSAVNPRLHLVPWKRIRELRASAARDNGFFSLPDLAQLSELSPEQLTGLAEEFPSANPAALRTWRPVLQFYLNLTPEMRQRTAAKEGLRYADAGLVARAALEDGPDPQNSRGLALLKSDPEHSAVSLRVEATKAAVPGTGQLRDLRRLTWEVRAQDTPPHLRALLLEPRKPLQPE